MSLTCNNKSASKTSSIVDSKDDINSCGKSLIKPIVSNITAF